MSTGESKMSMPAISVVIPTYNRAIPVTRAVQSVLSQSMISAEIVVVDDGSTDDTEESLSPFMDQIRYIKTKNCGVSAARNRGIIEASGEWIAFLDSDDFWDAEKLRLQLRAVTQTGATVCFCVSVNEDGFPVDDLQVMDPALNAHEIRFYPPGDLRIFTAIKHPLVQSLLAAKRTLLKCGLFDESLQVAEDTKLVYRLALDWGYVVVNTALVRICRDRHIPGLSDVREPENAFRQYECYVRVQAEAYWRLISRDKYVAARLRHNLLYFVSRQAEIACALGRKDVAKRYASAGMNIHSELKCIVRNIFVLRSYCLAKRHYARKWRVHCDQ